MGTAVTRTSGIRLWWISLIMGVACVLLVGTLVQAAEETIKVGACPDLSGPTSEVGRPFSSAVRDYFGYINAKGGINGRKIEYLETDGAYNIPQETAAFKRFGMEGMISFIGWSGGGQLQIARMAVPKKIVTLGASLSEVFADAKKQPYSFIHCASYDQVWRGLIDHAINKNPGKKIRAVIIYPDNPYGHQNAEICRKYLKKRGCDLVGEEIVGFKDIDATAQMLKIKALNPDIALCPQVEPSIAVIMRDAKKVGIDTKKVQFYVNFQGIGPVGIKLGGKNVEDLIGGSPFSSWEEQDIPGIKLIREVNTDKKSLLPWYIHGWTAAMVICEGLRVLGDKEVTGENLKKSLESIKNYDTGGLTSPISFSPTNHIGGKGVKLFRANVDKGYFEAITDFAYPK
jgi:branched-chain amino acid transport system substrate-binding protein